MKNILAIIANAQSDINDKINDLPNSGGVSASTLTNILFWVYGLAGLTAVAVIVYGGIKYVMSQGEPAKMKQASQILAYAVIGLIVVLLAGAITAFATGMIGGAAE
ncbi:hypothetical protein IKW75_03170 [Candidatus Saccharibacteria bacterium]|nr:hypothetical protein [Candidatus Saccharibacteria bacterium]